MTIILTATNEPNAELLIATLERVKAHPEEWDQGQWCGTPCCFAGHAVIVAGGRLDDDDDELVVIDNLLDGGWNWTNGEQEAERAHVAAYAREVLCLTQEQADELFCAYNTLGDLTAMVEILCSDDPDSITGYRREEATQ